MSYDGAPTPAMAAGNVHRQRSGGTVDDETDRISELPDDVLLDILGRVAVAGDHHTVARTSAISRRWRSLPWPQIKNVSLDVGNFFLRSDEWIHVRRRHRFAEQHHATAGFTDALARFLAPTPPSNWVIERLSLNFILTRRDYVRRIGDLVGDAAAAGKVKNVELEIVTEMKFLSYDERRTMLGYGARFKHLMQDCAAAFRSLTKLTLQYLWFHGPAALNDVVRGCGALEFLHVNQCGFIPDGVELDDGDGGAPPCALTIDAPRSRLRMLVCNFCYIGRLELAQAPELAFVQHRAFFLEDSHPISFGCTPSLQGLSLSHGREEEDDDDVKLKIWVQPEHPKHLGAALRGLRELHLKNIHPDCDLSWATFLLEAAPLLLTLELHIFDHPCSPYWHKKGDWSENVTWQLSPEFRHHHLAKLSFHRAFHLEKDLPFARLVMELAVNLQSVTFRIKSARCDGCPTAQRKFPGLAKSRLRFTQGNEHADAFVKELKHGIPTSAEITVLFSDSD
ncbi:hypothetical protein ACP70R_026026 [Stipagrostis hirtigluma subsp. patula]